jgi:hypothetical protein
LTLKSLRNILIIILLINFTFSSIFFNIGSENTNGEINIIQAQSAPFEELPQLNSRINSLAAPYIIDLNTTTAKPHHNITIYGADGSDGAGMSITSGDINGDLINDIIISAPSSWGPNNYFAYSGEVYVIFGNSTPSPIIYLKSQPDIVLYGGDRYDRFGTVVTTGDINGDGIEDLLVSARAASGENNLRNSCGEVYIFYGNPSFPSIWDLSTKPANVTIYGKEMVDYIGDALTSGDVNGDNKDDIIIGCRWADGPNNTRTNSGEAYVIYGNVSLPPLIDLAVFNTSNYTTIYGRDIGDYFGMDIAVGDVNSDNFDDLIVSAPLGSGLYNIKSVSGEVHIIFGNQSLNSTIDLSGSMANFTIFGADTGDMIGKKLTSGNINGDDFDDIIIGAIYADGQNESKSDCGEVYIIYGNTSFQQNIFTNEADIIIYGQETQDNMGNAIAVGDVNGDNYDDLIIGASQADGSREGNDFGEAYIINGSNSLPSTIDLASDNPDILIYGAEGSIESGYYGDRAGTTVLLSDLNGDNKDEIILSAMGADGRSNKKLSSGEIYIILSGGNLLPIPIIESVTLENGQENDKKTCYAMKYPYLFRVKITVPNNLEDLNTVILDLTYDNPFQNLKYEWSTSTKEFVEVLDQYNHANLNPKSEYNNYFGRVWDFDFYLDFNWTYPDEILHAVQVIATGYTGFQDLTSLNNFYRVKTYLNFYGNLTVTGEYQGKLSENAWVRKGEQLTWSGLKVIYDGLNNEYPSKDAGVTVTVSNSSGGAWIVNAGDGETISIKTYANNNTKFGEIYSISITGVPSYCDKSYITFKLNIDADGISFSNPFPNNRTWFPTLKPTCGIRISDHVTNVNSSSIQYLTSTNNGITWSNWTEIGIQGISQGKGVNCTVKPILKEGYNNLIQWHARDIVGNNYTESETYQILVDISPVYFSNPLPNPDIWQNNLSVLCNITIFDEYSGVNASSIEFSTSTNGIWRYDDWQSARLTVNGNILHCSVTPNFIEGEDNYIRWRARDIAGNPYNISNNYQIRIKLNNPPETSLISPRNRSIINTSSPEFVWKYSDLDNDTELYYDIYLSSELDEVIKLSKSAHIVTIFQKTSYTPEVPLSDSKTYYWTVIPDDNITRGICKSIVWQFKININVEIPTVTLSSPSINSEVTTTTPKLSWEILYSYPNFISFDIYLSDSPYPTDLYMEENRIAKDYKLTTFIIQTSLTPGETYYWTVIPTANLPDGIIQGDCKSGVWNFRAGLPTEHVYELNMNVETQNQTVVQGNYTSTKITITNKGNTVDMIGLSLDKGILNANVALEHLNTPIRLSSNEHIALKLEILVSEDAKPQNYSISITAISNGALSENKEVSVTNFIQLTVIEKKKDDEIIDPEDESGAKTDQYQFRIVDIILWSTIIIILILMVGIFLFIYRINKAKKIPLLKSQLLSKLPKHLALQEAAGESEKESKLPSGEETVPALGTPSTISTQYQLPKAILTNAQKLVLLKERFILGEVSEETYKELKAELESSKDITLVEEEIIPEEFKPPVVEVDIEEKEAEEVQTAIEDIEDIDQTETKEAQEVIKDITIEEQPDIRKSISEEPEAKIDIEELSKESDLKIGATAFKRKKKKISKKGTKIDHRKDNEKKVNENYKKQLKDSIELEEKEFLNTGICVSCGLTLDSDVEYCWNCGTRYKVNK